MPLISVIIAAYNAESTIAITIDSLLSQTLADIELIIGDDASMDGTAEVVRGYNDSRIRLLVNEKNMGAGPTRDRLISAASGKFLAFVDADDAVAPERFERLLQVMPEGGDCLLFDDIMQCHHTSSGMVPWRPVHGSKAFSGYAGDELVGPLSITDLLASRRLLLKPLVKREVVVSLQVRHPAIDYGEDGVFFWTLVARGIPAFYWPKAYYHYRISPGSASSAVTRHDALAGCIDILLQERLSCSDRRVALQRQAVALAQGKVKRLARRGVFSKFRAFWVLLSNRQYLSFYLSGLPRSLGYNLSRFLNGGQKR